MNFTKDEDGVIALARHLGYWPSHRQIKRHLGIGSDYVANLRKAAEPRWEGPPNVNSALGNGRRQPTPVIIGGGAPEPMTREERDALWERAIRESQAHAERTRRRQSIEFPPEPFALAMLGDTHIGDVGVDYASLKADAEIVRDTPGMYALFGGDGTNNWVVGKLQALQRNEIMAHSSSWALFLDWLDTLGPKLAAVVVGNHDLWTAKVSGFEPIARHLRGAAVLYDPHELVFTLACGELEQRWLVRHKFRYGSVFNATHGQEVAWDRGDTDFDVAVGFHRHNGTLVRPFVRHGRKRHAVQMGTYKVADVYADESGFPRPPSLGRGTFVGHPDGRSWWFDEIEGAADFLAYLRST